MPLHARTPMSLGNSSEALRQYQDSTIDSLRERCARIQADGLPQRPERRAIRNGYVLTQGQPDDPGRYTVFAFDQDRRLFWMIDGQVMARSLRPTLKISLPRDYARCRFVRDPAGLEQFEVVHAERNRPSDARVIGRLIQDARDLALQGPTSAVMGAGKCATPSGRPSTTPDDLLLVDGEPLTWRACHEPTLLVRDRLARLVRRAHGQ